MSSVPIIAPPQLPKAPTGIAGFDLMTGGGLPHGRTALLAGGPGSGKTIFALQFLVHGARQCAEPGIFVAFEERSSQILANAGSFGWDLAALQPDRLFFLDAQPSPNLVQSGDFDFSGMLAALGAKALQMQAQRIVFDALDIVLDLLPDAAAQRREIYRLHEWLLARELTGLITLKANRDGSGDISEQPLGFMQFMVECAVVLQHRVMQGVSQRSLRVQKYRGSSFNEDEESFLIGKHGFDVALARTSPKFDAKVSNERISSGVERLDTMLGGGYYRGASILITGSPGTAKTTLSGSFAQAACLRGERTLFISYDSNCDEVVRNLSSVDIHLARFVESGVLEMVSARAIAGSAEAYLMRIKMLAKEHQARCVVIDPVSIWSKSGIDPSAYGLAERLIEWSKGTGITLMCTRLMEAAFNNADSGPSMQIPTLADTWIHLSYLVQAGERNRGLSIIKSRGTAHSNQVRELVLSDTGVTLTDIYSAAGEVLMGTMRWEKERSEQFAKEIALATEKIKRVKLDAEEAEFEVRLKSLQAELVAKQLEKALLAKTTAHHDDAVVRDRAHIQVLRGADVAGEHGK
jgi:circadian clock protein KaiC